MRSEQGSILLSLLDPSTNPDTPRVIQRGAAGADFTTDLMAPNGVVAVISGGESDFGTSDNGFRIEANQQFVNLRGGSSFIDESNAAPLTVLPSAQASQFQQVFEQNTPARLVELEIEAAVLASLSAAITNPANTVESASQAATIESQALTQQSEGVAATSPRTCSSTSPWSTPSSSPCLAGVAAGLRFGGLRRPGGGGSVDGASGPAAGGGDPERRGTGTRAHAAAAWFSARVRSCSGLQEAVAEESVIPVAVRMHRDRGGCVVPVAT
ncbi:MAG: hypothetical protein U5R48_14920 [Gammaproteobacteria bacterium]|nr:hypothetical protein [Gammaproteobacteria bacterium]